MKIFILFFFMAITAIGQTDLLRAEQYFMSKQYSNAEALMVTYVKNNPKDLKAIELLGDAYVYQKKWDGAIVNYKKLVEISPKTANYHYKYGGAMGMKALSINKIKALALIGEVKQAFMTAAELDGVHLETRWALVELYMQLPGIVGGSKSKSLIYANELENLSKVDGYLAKGYIYGYNNEFYLAEKYYKLAVIEGGSLVCYEKLTNLYETYKRPDQAIVNMEAAIVKHNENLLHYQIGKVSAEYLVQLEKGEEHLKTYLKNFTSKDSIPKAFANYRLAQIYKLQNKKLIALKHIDLAIAELPKEESFKMERRGILKLK